MVDPDIDCKYEQHNCINYGNNQSVIHKNEHDMHPATNSIIRKR